MLCEKIIEFVNPTQIITGFLISAAFVLILIDYFITKTKRYGLPPGPTPLPILGSALQVIGRPLYVTFAALRKEYGDIFSVKVGEGEIIVVNGFKNIQQLLVKEKNTFSYRPAITWSAVTQRKGLFSVDGDVHTKQITYVRKILTEIGWDQSDSSRDRTTKHAQELVEWLQETNGKPIDPLIYFDTAVCNTNSSSIIGSQFKPTDDLMKALSKISMEIFLDAAHHNVNNFLPILRKAPGDFTNYKRLVNSAATATGVIGGVVKSHKERLADPAAKPVDFVDHYLKLIEENQPTCTEEQLVAVLTDLVAMGIEAGSTTLRWIVLLLAQNPKVQREVQEEIDAVIGTDIPTIDYKREMNYTRAVITEVQRVCNVVHINLPHSCARDEMFMGYRIPAGSIIIPNLTSIHYDSDVYKNPTEFDPSRHLADKNQFTAPTSFMPYSAGTRSCFGRILAELELFTLMVSIYQKFNVELTEGPGEDLFGLIRYPGNYKVKFVTRNEND